MSKQLALALAACFLSGCLMEDPGTGDDTGDPPMVTTSPFSSPQNPLPVCSADRFTCPVNVPPGQPGSRFVRITAGRAGYFGAFTATAPADQSCVRVTPVPASRNQFDIGPFRSNTPSCGPIMVTVTDDDGNVTFAFFRVDFIG